MATHICSTRLLGSAVLVIRCYKWIYTYIYIYLYIRSIHGYRGSWRFISMIISSFIHKSNLNCTPRPLGASTCHGRPSCLCRCCGACGVFRACGRQTNKRGRAWKMAWVAGLKQWIFKWWLGGGWQGPSPWACDQEQTVQFYTVLTSQRNLSASEKWSQP